MLDNKQIEIVRATVRGYINTAMPARRGDEDFFDDLSQETFLVILEGKATDYRFAVKKAARQLGYDNGCEETTNHGFVDEEGTRPSTPRNTGNDFVQQTEVNDWIDNALNSTHGRITKMLVEGYSQAEIALCLGVSQQTISATVRIIRAIAKEDFNVN